MTLLLYDDLCLTHIEGVPHVESPDRLRAIVTGLRAGGLWRRCEQPPPRDATADDLALVHTAEHIRRVRNAAGHGHPGALDLDTPVSAGSYPAALRAVGLMLEGADRIADGRARNGFAAIRPPGHHATPDRGMGFCLFNNVAIAARHLQRRHGLRKILIVDWDIHHGNGTQAVFHDDGSVMYISAHAAPFYPHTGAEEERGAGEGLDTNINFPLPLDTPPSRFVDVLTRAMLGPGWAFQPDFVLVSAGFDAAAGDPIGVFALQPADYAALTRTAAKVAAECCDGRLLSALEGGYNLAQLSSCAAAHVGALLEADGS